jgi:DNA topoisomerase-2
LKQLRDDGYDPFPKETKGARATGTSAAVSSTVVAQDDDNDDDNDDDDASAAKGGEGDYNYLLSMALWSLTLERVEQLKAQRDDKEKELAALLKESIEDLWRKDLDALR